MDEILGKWIFISQHGVEECLIKQNIGWIKRKLILSLAPNIIYSQPDENILRVEFQTKVKNMVRDYKWPGVTQHKDHDGDDVETETLLEDEKVTLICTGKPYGPLKTVREILPDGTLKVQTILTDLNVSCYRLFKRE